MCKYELKINKCGNFIVFWKKTLIRSYNIMACIVFTIIKIRVIEFVLIILRDR